MSEKDVPEKERPRVLVGAWLPPELAEAIEVLAQRECRSKSGQIRMLLEEALRAREGVAA